MNGMATALPEFFLALSTLALVLYAAFGSARSGAGAALLALVALVGTGWLVLFAPAGGVALSGFWIVDVFARFAKVAFLAGGVFALGIAHGFYVKEGGIRAEYVLMILFALLGMMMMASAHDGLTLYLGLELQGLALYVLACFRSTPSRTTEAGVKYFVLGAISSAVFLFGLSFLYGHAGALAYDALARSWEGSGNLLGLTGLVFVLAGLAFKLAIAPFHMWSPDVYEGAPTPVTAFLTTAPKVAGLVVVVRLLLGPFEGAADMWGPVVAALAFVSMLWGSFAGLLQANVKRLMAYSAIAHMGMVFLALAACAYGVAKVDAVGAILIYLVIYLFAAFGVFAVLVSLRREGETLETVRDLSGLIKTHPSMALAMGVCLFSLAGIPPLAGFFAKYFVFIAAIKGGLIWLSVVGILATVVAAAYYLKIVRVMAFEPSLDEPAARVTDGVLSGVVWVSAVGTGLYLLFPSFLIDASRQAAESLLK